MDFIVKFLLIILAVGFLLWLWGGGINNKSDNPKLDKQEIILTPTQR